jgi:hypothetical protein
MEHLSLSLELIWLFFLTKNDIHSFKLIKYIEQYNSRSLKTEKDESVNKLTASTLIAYNGKMSTIVTKPTNMTNLKCSEYPCLRVCNVDDAKVIDCWICTESNLICQLEPNKHRTKTGQQTNAATRRRPTKRQTEMTKSEKEKLNICENHLFK